MNIIKKWMSDHTLSCFFILTLAWTWICGFIPVVLGLTGTAVGTFIFYFGGGAPSVVALFIVLITYSREEKKDFFKRCFSFRYMGLKWLLIVALIFALLSTMSVYIGVRLFGYDMPTMDYIHMIMDNPLVVPLVLLISLISGPLNEEFGWRGYALDKLLIRFGFMKASLILGFIWAIWHLPWYFTPGQAQYDLLQNSIINAVMFIPSVMLLSVFVSFVYIKTKRSILAGAMVHMLSNLLGSQLLSSYTVEMSMLIRYINIGFYIIILLYAICSKRFRAEAEEQIVNI